MIIHEWSELPANISKKMISIFFEVSKDRYGGGSLGLENFNILMTLI